MTAFYMWRLMGKTFYGAVARRPAVEPKIHESPWQMTLPLILLAIPSVILGIVLTWPGPPLGPLFGGDGTGSLKGWLEPVFAQAEAILQRDARGVPDRRHRRRADHRSASRRRRIGLVAGIFLFGFFRNGGHAATRRARITIADRAYPVPVPRLAQQVVVRRPQRPAVHRDRRAGRGGPVVVRPRSSSTARSTASATLTRDAGGGLRRIQTGRVQNYALGIAIGLLVMAGSFLVIVAAAAMTCVRRDLPLVSLVTFLPLLGALARRPRAPRAGPRRAAASRSRFALVAWVVSLGAAGRLRARHGRGDSSSSSTRRLDPAVRHPVPGRRRRPVARRWWCSRRR